MPRRLVLLAVGLALLAPATAHAASPDIVISQLYGGGGNSGATYTNDFIELQNRGSAAVDVGGWSVQYASASGTSWQVTPLTGTIAPGDRYLVQEGAGAGGTTPLPSPDATGSIAMSGTSGKVALVTTAAALPCGAACASAAGVKDFVGYGAANDFETAPAPGLSNTTAAIRGGGADTDDNAADFTAGAPAPGGGGTPADAAPTVASSDPADEAREVARGASVHVTFSEPVTIDPGGFVLTCGGDAQAATVTQDGPATVTVDPDADLPEGSGCALRITAGAVHDTDGDDPPDTLARDAFVDFSTTGLALAIHEIQGAAHRSPYADRWIAGVEGVVTGVSASGFWMQDQSPDADVRTSEGIFVFNPATDPAVRDRVRVSGRVQEFRPGGSGGLANLTTTEIAQPVVEHAGSGTIRPTLVGPGGRRPPTHVVEDDAMGDVEAGGFLFDPGEDALDFYESLEGMLVHVDHPQVVGPLTSNGELAVVAEPGTPRTSRGGLLLRPDDVNPERLILDDAIATPPPANVGDRLGPVDALVDYSFGNFKFEVTSVPQRFDRGLQQEVTQAPRSNELAIASINLENLSAVSPDDKFARLAKIVVANLRSPDILAVEEMQDNDGAASEGNPDATRTFEKFVAAVAAAGGPHYEYRQINPEPGADGGEPGGNIRVGFLFRTDRGLSFVDRPGGTATNGTLEDTSKPGAQLTLSPGRIDPGNPAWLTSRKPLVGEFSWRGKKVFAIANHFNSKGGDDPLLGRYQPPQRSSEVQRHKQATVLRDFVRTLLRADPLARIAVMGDFNDFDFSQTLKIVRSGGLVNLMDTLPPNERYSYVFDGNSQVLDQILVSPRLLFPFPEYDSVHVNAEFADQASDHDPQIARVVP
jgi:uncharacterized protein